MEAHLTSPIPCLPQGKHHRLNAEKESARQGADKVSVLVGHDQCLQFELLHLLFTQPLALGNIPNVSVLQERSFQNSLQLHFRWPQSAAVLGLAKGQGHLATSSVP